MSESKMSRKGEPLTWIRVGQWRKYFVVGDIISILPQIEDLEAPAVCPAMGFKVDDARLKWL
jgi:hypothetical protein